MSDSKAKSDLKRMVETLKSEGQELLDYAECLEECYEILTDAEAEALVTKHRDFVDRWQGSKPDLSVN